MMPEAKPSPVDVATELILEKVHDPKAQGIFLDLTRAYAAYSHDHTEANAQRKHEARVALDPLFFQHDWLTYLNLHIKIMRMF
jgi:hypothetical protein